MTSWVYIIPLFFIFLFMNCLKNYIICIIIIIIISSIIIPHVRLFNLFTYNVKI